MRIRRIQYISDFPYYFTTYQEVPDISDEEVKGLKYDETDIQDINKRTETDKSYDLLPSSGDLYETDILDDLHNQLMYHKPHFLYI